MSLKFLRKNNIIKKIIDKLAYSRVQEKYNTIKYYINSQDKILDIGSGNCMVVKLLKNKKFNVIPLDVKNLSFDEQINPRIYEGEKIPFEDNKFDLSLILTVLHHTNNPEEIILEAKRVSKRIIIIEEIYTNAVNKYITYFIDSLFNFQFINHPHTNKNDEEWKLLFNRLDLKLIDKKYHKSAWMLNRAIYYLKK